MAGDKSRGSIVVGVMLMGLGLTWATVNLNWLSPDVWDWWWRGWPVILALVGVEMIVGKSWWGGLILSLVGFVTAMAVVGGVLGWWSWVGLWPGNWPKWQWWQTHWFNEQVMQLAVPVSELAQVTKQRLIMKIEGGSLQVKDQEGEIPLMADLRYRGEVPELISRKEKELLLMELVLDKEEKNWWERNFSRGTVTLGQINLPTELMIEAAAGDLELMLDEQNLALVVLTLKAGRVEMQLGEKSTPEDLHIQLEAGTARIQLPEATIAKVEYAVRRGSLIVDGVELQKEGVHQLQNFRDGGDNLTMKVEVGFGRVEVERHLTE